MLRRYSTKIGTKYNRVRSAWKQKIILPEGLVHNPTPAAPSAYETPAAFLPKSDGRTIRKDSQDAADLSLMPLISQTPKRTYHLTSEDAAEIQRLRETEPDLWTRKALAQKFGVSEMVIGLVSKPNRERDSEMQHRLEVIRGMWTDKRVRAREHRAQRKQQWLADA